MTETAHLDRAAALLLSVGRTALGNIDTGAALHCLQARALHCDAGAQPLPLAPPRTVDSPAIARQTRRRTGPLAVMQALLGFHQ
jgi:hypothetical protein